MGIMSRMIGIDKFTDSLEQIESTVEFVNCSNLNPQYASRIGCSLRLYDRFFADSIVKSTRMTKTAIVNAFIRGSVSQDSTLPTGVESDQVTVTDLYGIIESYKVLIRQQDSELTR